ncbi:MAG: type II secretion system protein GspM [Gammaproteobacteria bacterium]
MKRALFLITACLLMAGYNLSLWRTEGTLSATLETRLKQIDWLDQAIIARASSPPRPPAPPARGALALMKQLELEAKRANLDKLLTRMDQQSDHAVRLIYDEVSFNRLINWLNQVHHSNGLQPQSVTIKRLPTAGRVTAELEYR